MILIREAAGVMTAPLVMIMVLALAAVACRLGGRPRASRLLLIGAAILAYLSCVPFVGHALLRPLESKFPPLESDQTPAVGYVVVLGSSYRPHDGIPASAALDEDGLARAVEAVCLVRRLPGARLVVSGGASPPGYPPVAQGYAQLARELGIAAQSIVVSERPLDTRAEAREVARLLGRTPFLLVTSAYHMPRAMLLMRRAGAAPIAAPAGQRAYGATPVVWRDFLPGSRGLRDTERALHEYAGLAAIGAGLQ
jgi:uncharacterized SAM-binding protein YcdF (DUF218 family)